MKNRVLLSVAVLMVLSGCQVEESFIGENGLADGMKTVVFETGGPDTRTVFTEGQDGRYPVLWTNDDAIFLSMNCETPLSLPVDLGGAESASSASFSAAFKDGLREYTFYAVTPTTAVESFNTTRKAWLLTIPAVQTPIAGSTDEAAQILAASTDTFTSLPSNMHLHFKQVTAYMRMTLSNLESAFTAAGFGDAVIRSIDLTFGTGVAGTWYYGMQDASFEAKEASSTITLTTSSASDLWFALAPVDISEKTLKITVNTDKGSVSRTITFESLSANSGLALTPGGVFTISVNMASAVQSFTDSAYMLVTDTSSLEAGDEVLIASTDGSGIFAMSTTQNTDSRGSTAVTMDGLLIVNPSSSVERFTLETDSDGRFYFKTADGKYLSSSTSKKTSGTRVMYYYLVSSQSKNASVNGWSVDIMSSGLASMMVGDSYEMVFYANSANLFVGYASDVYANYSNYMYYPLIFEKIDLNPAFMDDAVLSKDEYGAYLSDWSFVYEKAVHNLSREYDEASGTVSFSILEPASERFLQFYAIPSELEKGDRFIMGLVMYSGMNKTVDEAYQVVVEKVEGPKVWLSSLSGESFIIKK